MSDVIGARAPIWFRLLAVLGLAWTVAGVYMYFYLGQVGMSVDSLAGLVSTRPDLAASAPGWVTGVFKVALYAGLGGAFFLVVLKRLAKSLLIASLLAILVQRGWIVGMSDARAVEGNMAFVMPGLVALVALLLAWLAMIGDRKGWLS